MDVETDKLEPDAIADTDLDAVISKALDGQAADDAPVVDDAPSDGRVRDATGRFVSREPDKGGTDAPVADSVPEKTADAPAVQPEATADGPKWTDGHFAGWKPEQRERFNALPPDVQELVMARQAENQAFYQRKLAEESEFRRQAEPVYKAAQEVEPYARSIGTTPDVLMRNLAAIDQSLRYAPYAKKVEIVGEIAKFAGVPFAQPEVDPYADPLQPNGQAYPIVHDLQTQVQQLQAQLQTYQHQHQSLTQQRVTSEIEAFASTKAADGSPQYPYFEVVKASMGQLLADGKANTLAEAYQLATKPLEDRIAADLAAKQRAAQAKQAEAVARAKKAAPVRASGVAPGGQTKGGGLDNVLNSALAAHGL